MCNLACDKIKIKSCNKHEYEMANTNNFFPPDWKTQQLENFSNVFLSSSFFLFNNSFNYVCSLKIIMLPTTTTRTGKIQTKRQE